MSLHGWKLYLLFAWIVLLTVSTGASLYAAHGQVDQIDQRLHSSKVCSEQNQGEACRALFERLSANISDAQRQRLACTVFRTAGVKLNIDCPEG